jgi:hypothetical protein
MFTVRRQRKCNEMSSFEIGDRVEIVGKIASDLRSTIGVVTAIVKKPFSTKFTVRLADGMDSVFWDSQLQIPPVLFADMIFDTQASPTGLRGSPSEHHMQFICREVDIYLTLTGAEEHKTLYGQVTASGVALGSSLITLLFDSEPYATTATDSRGEFKLDQIPSGKATLEVVVPSHRIVATFPGEVRL